MMTLAIVLGVTVLGLCGLLAAGVAMWRLDVRDKNLAQQRALTLREELDRTQTRERAAQARATLAEHQLAEALDRNLKEMHALKTKTLEALTSGNPGDKLSAGVGVWARALPSAPSSHDGQRTDRGAAPVSATAIARADTDKGIGHK